MSYESAVKSSSLIPDLEPRLTYISCLSIHKVGCNKILAQMNRVFRFLGPKRQISRWNLTSWDCAIYGISSSSFLIPWCEFESKIFEISHLHKKTCSTKCYLNIVKKERAAISWLLITMILFKNQWFNQFSWWTLQPK